MNFEWFLKQCLNGFSRTPPSCIHDYPCHVSEKTTQSRLTRQQGSCSWQILPSLNLHDWLGSVSAEGSVAATFTAFMRNWAARKISKRSIKWVRVIYTWEYSLQSIPKTLNGEEHFKGFPVEHPDGLDSCCCCRLLQARIAKWSETLVEHVPNIKTWKRMSLLWMGVNFSLNHQWKRRFESCTNASIL